MKPKIIPPELLEPLELMLKGASIQQPQPISPLQEEFTPFSIEEMLKGEPLHDPKLPIALRKALDHAGSDGIVLTLREILATKLEADKEHRFWKNWLTAHTEENIGIDKEGKFYGKGEAVLILINGGGILTPDRIEQAYAEDLITGSAKYRDEEFDGLLDGRSPDGSLVHLYPFEEIKSGITNLPHRYGVVMPYAIAQATTSGWHQKLDFLENPLVIARAGGLESLEKYYELAKDSEGKIGNWHPFARRDASQPQGRVLFVDNSYNGLYGDYYLSSNGRFVWVSAGGARARI